MTERTRLAIIIALLICVILIACGAKQTATQDDAEQPTTETVVSTKQPQTEIIAAEQSENEIQSQIPGTFIILNREYIGTGYSRIYQWIMYDPDNMVMYTLIDSSTAGGVAMSMMYNADGTPKIYTPEG